MKNKKKFGFIFLLVLIFITGCSSAPRPIRVAVDAYTDTSVMLEKTYFLELPKPSEVTMELEAKHFSREIDLMLYDNGYKKTFDRNKANYIISFQYDITGPITTGTVATRPVTVGMGFGYGGWGGSRRSSLYSGMMFNDVGFQDVVEIRETYRKSLMIRAADRKGTPYWEVVATNSNGVGNMRAVFPYLVRGASKYVGRNSDEIVVVEIMPMITNPQ